MPKINKNYGVEVEMKEKLKKIEKEEKKRKRGENLSFEAEKNEDEL